MQQGLARLKPGMHHNIQSIESKISHVSEGGPNDFTMFSDTIFTIAGKSTRAYLAAKLSYAKRCLVYVGVAVEATDDDGVEKLIRYVEQINVR